MRKFIVLLLCTVFMNSCSWFGSKSSSGTTLIDAESEMLDEDDESLALEKDIQNLSDNSSNEDDDLAELDELDDDDANTGDEEASDKLADELDLDDDELDADNVAEDSSAEETNKHFVEDANTDANNGEEEVASIEKNKEGEDSYSDGFADVNETNAENETEKTEVSDDAASTEEAFVDSSTNSFAAVSVKTYIPVKKIKSVPYTTDNILVNAVYIARKGDSLRSVSNKIYALYRKTQLLKINPHLRKYNKFPVGTKIYYSSPSRPEDSVNLLTYYEEQNLAPQVYTTVEGDNLRTLGRQLLGHSRSWQELWATNSAVDSKTILPAGVSIRYWSKASLDAGAQQAIAQNIAEKQAAKQAEVEAQQVARLAVIEQQRLEEEKLKLEANAQANKGTTTKGSAVIEGAGVVKGKKAPVNPNSLDNSAEDNINLAKKAEATPETKGVPKVENEVVDQQVPKVEVSEENTAAEVKPAVVSSDVKPVAVSPVVVNDQSFFDKALALLDDDMILYSLMGLFLLILIFLFMRKRGLSSGGGEYDNDNIETIEESTAMILGGSNKEVAHGQGGQMDATQMDATQDATQMDATQMDATQMDATQMDATQMNEDLGMESSSEDALLCDDEEKVAG